MTPEDYINRNTNHTKPQTAFTGNIFWTHAALQKCFLGNLHDKQLAILPMRTVYELFFPQLSRQKKKKRKKADVQSKTKQAKLPYLGQLQLESNQNFYSVV